MSSGNVSLTRASIAAGQVSWMCIALMKPLYGGGWGGQVSDHKHCNIILMILFLDSIE